MSKQRLSASVDRELVAAALEAVGRREAESVSAWVNEALRLKRDHDRRLAALGAFIAAYEADHGVISPEEMHQAQRRARARAVVVRSTGTGRPASGRRRRRAG